MNWALADVAGEVIETTDDVIDWGEQAVNVKAAWKKAKGEGVKVAVLDTGWPEHPDIGSNLVGQADFTGEGGADSHGHGTHVAGIIGALDNGIGVVGVAPRCSLLCARVIPISVESVVAALDWAKVQGAQIVNMSWGGSEDVPEIHEKLQELYDDGIILIAAAGNTFNPAVDTISFPARYPEVLAVAALDHSLKHAPFSAAGSEIENAIALPGVNILSTWLQGGYARLSGTSMAAPMLAGMAALILQALKPAQDQTHKALSVELVKIDKQVDDFHYIGRGMPVIGDLADDPQADPNIL